MGFSLQIAPLNDMIGSDADEAAFRSFLRNVGFDPDSKCDLSAFGDPFYEVEEFEDEDEDGAESYYVAHPEVGWSWWSKTQALVASLLGESQAKNTNSIHAWYGVAVPADFEPFIVGDPIRRQPPAPKKEGLLAKFGIKKSDSHDDQVAQMIDQMVFDLGGPTENLYVVSGIRLLCELDEAAAKLGTSNDDPLALYESVDDDDADSVARCYLAIARKMLREGIGAGQLVWWRK